jgi:hypothetical protein
MTKRQTDRQKTKDRYCTSRLTKVKKKRERRKHESERERGGRTENKKRTEKRLFD